MPRTSTTIRAAILAAAATGFACAPCAAQSPDGTVRLTDRKPVASLFAPPPGEAIRAAGGAIRLSDHTAPCGDTCDGVDCEGCGCGCGSSGCRGACGGNCNGNCGDDGFLGGLRGWCADLRERCARRRANPMYFEDHLKRLCCPWCTDEGRGGGEPLPLAGHYGRTYPHDPHYFDQRDGMAYSAYGYGVPMAVPLSPVVNHQWNYSHGTPAARISPISRMPGQ